MDLNKGEHCFLWKVLICGMMALSNNTRGEQVFPPNDKPHTIDGIIRTALAQSGPVASHLKADS